MMDWHSAAVIAIGFSHQTCLPASAAKMAYLACNAVGVTTYTTSISALSAMRGSDV